MSTSKQTSVKKSPVLPPRKLDARTAAYHEAGHALIFEEFMDDVRDSDHPPWTHARIWRTAEEPGGEESYAGGTISKRNLQDEHEVIQYMAGLAAEVLLLDVKIDDGDLAKAIIDEWLPDDGSSDLSEALNFIEVAGESTRSAGETSPLASWEQGALIRAITEALKVLRMREKRWRQLAEAILERHSRREAKICWSDSDINPQPRHSAGRGTIT